MAIQRRRHCDRMRVGCAASVERSERTAAIDRPLRLPVPSTAQSSSGGPLGDGPAAAIAMRCDADAMPRTIAVADMRGTVAMPLRRAEESDARTAPAAAHPALPFTRLVPSSLSADPAAPPFPLRPPFRMAEQSAWHASVQREDAHKQQQQDGGTAAAAAHSTAAGQAAQPASASASPPPSGLGDLASSMPSLFPSLLSPSPFHHSPSHSIVTLSAAAPSLVPPSPLLSESPSAPQQHQHLGNEHILNNPRLIVNVWQSNLQEELAKILQIVDEYPYIAMVRTRAGRITGKRASAAAGAKLRVHCSRRRRSRGCHSHSLRLLHAAI